MGLLSKIRKRALKIATPVVRAIGTPGARIVQAAVPDLRPASRPPVSDRVQAAAQIARIPFLPAESAARFLTARRRTQQQQADLQRGHDTRQRQAQERLQRVQQEQERQAQRRIEQEINRQEQEAGSRIEQEIARQEREIMEQLNQGGHHPQPTNGGVPAVPGGGQLPPVPDTGGHGGAFPPLDSPSPFDTQGFMGGGFDQDADGFQISPHLALGLAGITIGVIGLLRSR